MKTGRSHGRVAAALLALSTVFGITLFSGVKAQAQNPDWRDGQYRRDRDRDYDRDRDRERERRRRERERERERERRADQNNGYYGNGRNGGYYGQGGYGQYGTYGGYGRNRGYGNVYQIAADRGYQDGISTGQQDAYRGQSYDPQRSHYYRNADDGYSSSYGNKNAYRQAYRNGFVQGYHDGYRNNGGYGRGGYGRGGYGRNRAGSILGGIFGRP